MVGQVQVEDDGDACCICWTVGTTVGDEVDACMNGGLVASRMRPGVLCERQDLFRHVKLKGRCDE